MYKIIAIDADGTLLDEFSRIPSENKDAIKAAQQAGVHVALCSGRSAVSLRKFAVELDLRPELSYIISFNGGVVFDGYNNRVRDIRIPRETALQLLRWFKPFNIVTAVYTETDEMMCECDASEIEKYTSGSLIVPIFVESLAESLAKDPHKIILFGENEVLQGIAAHMLPLQAQLNTPCDMCFSSKRLLEFSDAKSTKGAGLEFVCARLGFDIAAEAIAIGDSFNDLSMITAAALGVCMANGEEPVKAKARYVTRRTNSCGGVAEVIEKFVNIAK